ncbi:hypothetical protein H5410_055141 [Solanum commersonii]|uniref:Uncharacterized protein n=1 Tax=Solanum commersonii TaxID=4109 RepID=A0A9J5WI68_SOLCO|nr:hypothetical protein H5410_055141 [Solanum commersonii]
MAYAALSSLMYTLNQFLKPNQSLVCRCCTQQHLESLCQNLSALQDVLNHTTTKDIETLKVIEKRIRNVVYKAEDRIDSSLRSIILADRKDKRQKAYTSFYEELLKVEEQVYFLNKEVMLIEFNKHGNKSAELASISSSLEKSAIEENTIVGMEDDFNIILDRLTSQTEELTAYHYYILPHSSQFDSALNTLNLNSFSLFFRSFVFLVAVKTFLSHIALPTVGSTYVDLLLKLTEEMAYAALSSLMYTLEQQHVQSLYQNLSALQLFLDNTTTNDIETLKVIEKRIRNVVYKAEDRIDSSLRNIILADRMDKRQKACTSFYEELLKVEEQVYFLNKEVMLIEFNKHGNKSAELASISSSLEKSAIEENTIVGMEDDFNIILDRLTSQTEELTVIPIFGMGGIGKTTLARKVYDNSCIRSRFDKQAWVTISEEYNERQMLLELVSSITGSKQETSNDELMEIVYRGLKGRRSLIVIDDIWSTEAWDQMQRTFPNDDNRSRILLTTRLKYVADYVSCPYFPPHSKSFLSLNDSWNLFTEKLFKNDLCPPLLEKTGKHIVKQCRGLPLSVVVVAGLLGKMDPTHDNWKKVEENLNSFFGTVSERCQSILSLSYNYLPQYLKACFLYVGGFPEDREIDVSRLIKLWIAEQFVKARKDKRLEVVAEEYLQELIDRNLILTGKQRADGRMRTCKIHDLLRQLCLSEAHTENVVHVMYGNVLETIDDQRRVILMSEGEETYDYRWRRSSGIVRTFVSIFDSLQKNWCFIVSEFKLLKVLDVLSIGYDFYDFSSVIPELVHLRYVSARIEEAPSLAKLRSLQTIVFQSTRKTRLKQPVDIWRMSEIRHVDIRWSLYICNPLEAENDNTGEQPLFLNNLQTLYLYNSPFVAEITRRSPNLKKLKILDRSEHPDWTVILDSLSLLQDLETLHIVTKGNFCGDSFPPNLKQLKLTHTCIPWEDVKLLANLPNLEVLKGYGAFKGTYWKLDEDIVFHKLKYLQLCRPYGPKRWELAAGSDNFPVLEELILNSLYHLEEIPESIGDIMTLKFIEINSCCSSVVNSAKRIQQEQESLGNYELQVLFF